MDVRVYSKLEIEFLHVLYFRELKQWTNWPRPADSKPEHDGNSKKKACINIWETFTHAHTNTHTHTRSRTQVADWKHSSMTFVLFGRNVCRTIYLFAHGMGIKQYKRLNKHHDESGAESKHHGSSGRVAYTAYNVSDQIHVKFINYFAT